MKDGFDFHGVDIEAMAGSFGRWQIATQVGAQSGPWAVYWAGEKIEEDGFRDFSPVDVKRMYADLGAKGSFVEAHVNLTWPDSSAGVATASPDDILNVGWNRTFTTPQITDLEVVMPSFNIAVKATDTLTFSGISYYRNYKSNVVDGNLLDAEDCEEVADENGLPDPFAPGTLCSEEVEDGELEALRDAAGNPVNEDQVGEEPFGVIDNINQKAESWGGSVQAVEKQRVFGHGNQFLVGSSYDQGSVAYGTASEIGTIQPLYVVRGSGIFITEPDDFAPRNVAVDTKYFGVYFSDSFDITDEVTLTVGGRYNNAQIDLVDLSGNFPNITSSHEFSRFNPNAGLAYEFVPGISMYGGYSEANRAPTPAELACADPENPCPIESFLTDDPPLKQVVTDTWEAGFRGDNGGSNGHRFTWNAGLFRGVQHRRHSVRLVVGHGSRLLPQRRRHAPPGRRARRPVVERQAFALRRLQLRAGDVRDGQPDLVAEQPVRRPVRRRAGGGLHQRQAGRFHPGHSGESLQGRLRVLGHVQMEVRQRSDRGDGAVLPRRRGEPPAAAPRLRARRPAHLV